MRTPFREVSANVATSRSRRHLSDRWCGIDADTPKRSIPSPAAADWRAAHGVEEKDEDDDDAFDQTICLHRSGASVVRVAMDSPRGLLATFDAALSALALAIQPDYFRATWSQRNLGAGRPRRMEARKRLQQAQDDAQAALDVVRAVKTMDGAHAVHLEDQLRAFAAEVDALRDAAQHAEERSAAAAAAARAAHVQQLADAAKAHARASADARNAHTASLASAADARAVAAREHDALAAALQAKLAAARRGEAVAATAEAAARSAAAAARSVEETQHAAECARLRAAALRAEGAAAAAGEAARAALDGERGAAREKVQSLKVRARARVAELEAQLDARQGELGAARAALVAKEAMLVETRAMLMLRLQELTAGAKAKMKAMKRTSKAALAKVHKSAQRAALRAEAAEAERDQLRAQLVAVLGARPVATGAASDATVVVELHAVGSAVGAAVAAAVGDASGDAVADDIGALLARRVKSGDLAVDDAEMLRASLTAMEAQLAAGAITPSEFFQIKTTCFEGVRTGVLVETPTSTPTAATHGSQGFAAGTEVAVKAAAEAADTAAAARAQRCERRSFDSGRRCTGGAADV